MTGMTMAVMMMMLVMAILMIKKGLSGGRSDDAGLRSWST